MAKKSLSEGYIEDIFNALKWHRPCVFKGTHKEAESFFKNISAAGIRAPNDWQPEYTGAFAMRWYDGEGNHFSSSSKSICLSIVPKEKGFEFNFRGNVSGKYSDSGITINGLNAVQACFMLMTLVEIVDQTNQPAKGA
jgi:hypothetical protein